VKGGKGWARQPGRSGGRRGRREKEEGSAIEKFPRGGLGDGERKEGNGNSTEIAARTPAHSAKRREWGLRQ